MASWLSAQASGLKVNDNNAHCRVTCLSGSEGWLWYSLLGLWHCREGNSRGILDLYASYGKLESRIQSWHTARKGVFLQWFPRSVHLCASLWATLELANSDLFANLAGVTHRGEAV